VIPGSQIARLDLRRAGLGLGARDPVDELVLGYREHMRIMNLVHAITALHFGLIWLWLHLTRGRDSAQID